MKAVAVYGSSPNTGKSTVAKELAGFYYMQGYKTMLVDADLVKGSLTDKLGLNKSPNIGQWAEDILKRLDYLPYWDIEYSWDEIVPFLQNFKGLTALTSNTIDNLAGSPLLLSCINVMLQSLLKTPYDVLIFDNSGGVCDYTLNILLRMDKVLLVAEPFSFSLANEEAFLRLLEDEGFNLDDFGLVLNRYPTHAEQDPLEISRELGISLLGALPNCPDLGGRKGQSKIFTMQRPNRFTEEVGRFACKILNEINRF